MTTKEKANELTLIFTDLYKSTHTMAGDTNFYRERNYINWGRCFAKVAVDEIVKELNKVHGIGNSYFEYWKQVKIELEK